MSAEYRGVGRRWRGVSSHRLVAADENVLGSAHEYGRGRRDGPDRHRRPLSPCPGRRGVQRPGSSSTTIGASENGSSSSSPCRRRRLGRATPFCTRAEDRRLRRRCEVSERERRRNEHRAMQPCRVRESGSHPGLSRRLGRNRWRPRARCLQAVSKRSDVLSESRTRDKRSCLRTDESCRPRSLSKSDQTLGVVVGLGFASPAQEQLTHARRHRFLVSLVLRSRRTLPLLKRQGAAKLRPDPFPHVQMMAADCSKSSFSWPNSLERVIQIRRQAARALTHQSNGAQ